MSEKKRLIVNADDFGLSPGVNAGILRTHEHGIVSSASLMVRGSAAREAAKYARSAPALSVGLHIDLCEWEFRNGEWASRYQVVPLDNATAVREEIRRQLDAFIALTGRLPTHLDSHQHVHRREPIRSTVMEAAQELKIPVRGFADGIAYCGDFYGQTAEGEPFPDGISTKRLISLLDRLQPGITEVSCHPGDARALDSIYRLERELEADVLCDPRIKAAIHEREIELISFDGVNR